MAPALTQATEPHPAAARLSPPLPPQTSPLLRYGGTKEVSRNDFDEPRVNGRSPNAGLAPSLCGGAKCHPAKEIKLENKMDLPLNRSTTNHNPINLNSSSNSKESEMGCHIKSHLALDSLQSTTAKLLKSNQEIASSGDIMSLMGRDFENVNEIIDTLQKIACNPELIDAAERDISGSNTSSSSKEKEKCKDAAAPEEKVSTRWRDLSEQQKRLDRRRVHLLRRLRRVTARGLGATVSVQVRHLLNHAKTVLAEQKVAAKAQNSPNKLGSNSNALINPELGLESLQTDTMKSMSTSALVSLVRRVENNQLNSSKAPPPKEIQPALPEITRAELDTVAAEMYSAARNHLHHDSDATESSSGGESCDEMEVFVEKPTVNVPV